MGTFTVTALNDAVGVFPVSVDVAFPGASPSALAAARELDPRACDEPSVWRLSFRAFAVRGDDGRVLVVDLGVGSEHSPASRWAPTPGRLPLAMAAAGIRPEDVDVVVLTHLHSDHCGWVLGDDGEPLFGNAEHVIQHRELESLTEESSPGLRQHVVEPLRRGDLLRPIRGRQVLRSAGRSTVAAVPTPGHTPGHQSVVVTSSHDIVVVTGDAFVHAAQLADPTTSYVHEDDPTRAAATRDQLLELAGGGRSALATAHTMRPFFDVDDGAVQRPAP